VIFVSAVHALETDAPNIGRLAEATAWLREPITGAVAVAGADQHRALDIHPRVLRLVEIGVEEAFTPRPLRREREEYAESGIRIRRGVS
jgi:hypothetical protein